MQKMCLEVREKTLFSTKGHICDFFLVLPTEQHQSTNVMWTDPITITAPCAHWVWERFTWRCAGIYGRLDKGWASLSWHGQCHLLFFVFGQCCLHSLCVDIYIMGQDKQSDTSEADRKRENKYCKMKFESQCWAVFIQYVLRVCFFHVQYVVYLICSARPWPLHCGVRGGVWRLKMWRGPGPQDSDWGPNCGPGKAAHLAETDPHLPSRSKYVQVSKNTCRHIYIYITHNHDILESHRQTEYTLLYIMPLWQHGGINIIWYSKKYSKFSLTTEPLNMKWKKDLYSTDTIYTVNRVHKTRLDSSKYVFS